ncbi:hypothetical protein MMC17_000071 [Xylographa soralifera]|nr:hypothetical protein [Xylographa soralifera]
MQSSIQFKSAPLIALDLATASGTMSSSRTILITGATGKQGGAVIANLLAAQDSQPLHIIAVTRSKASKSAQSLAAKSNVSLVEGDLDDPTAIFKQTGPVWGVFSVQLNSDAEETQGKALIDAAVANGVSHFVYTSGDRGGPVKSPIDPTPVKNFMAKYNIEKYLVKQAAVSTQEMTYTILRPVTFFDNLTPDIHGKGFARMWQQIGPKKLQMVSTKDIGWFGATAFLHPEANRNRAWTLAGDELTQEEADVIFKEVMGTSMGIAPCVVGKGLKFAMKDTLGAMFQWFKDVGYGADVGECRRIHPEMQDYRAWLLESSPFVK